MKYSMLKEELQKRINEFNSKWDKICSSEYDGNYCLLYNSRLSDLYEDLRPIWEISYEISLIKEG